MEPATEYRYTTYYDPCTGCPQRVCQPCTSYRLRSKCNSVTSYVERCAMVPVTTLKPVTVRQPVVTYYYPPEPVCPPSGPSAAYFPPAPPLNPYPGGGPGVTELRENLPSVMPPNRSDMIPPTDIPVTPGTFPRPNTNTKL